MAVRSQLRSNCFCNIHPIFHVSQPQPHQQKSNTPHRLIACQQLGLPEQKPQQHHRSLACCCGCAELGWAIRAALLIPNVCDDSHAEMQRGRVRHWRSLPGDVCCCWHEAGLSRPLPWSAGLQRPCGQSVQVGANGAPTTAPTEPPTHLAPACSVCLATCCCGVADTHCPLPAPDV